MKSLKNYNFTFVRIRAAHYTENSGMTLTPRKHILEVKTWLPFD